MSEGITSKCYLGDSVYVQLEVDGMVRLTTENGYGPSNTIYLEPEVVRAFQTWLRIVKDNIRKQNRRMAMRFER